MKKYNPRLWELFLAWFLVILAVATLVLTVLAGCTPWDEIEVDESIYKVHNQDKAHLLTLARVEDHFDVRVRPHETDVSWTSTRCPYDTKHYAVVYEDVCFAGIMFGCDHMYVAVANRDPKRTCKTALIHEYTHCLLMVLGWEDAALPCTIPAADPDDLSWVGDANHSFEEFWLLTASVGVEACDRGW